MEHESAFIASPLGMPVVRLAFESVVLPLGRRLAHPSAGPSPWARKALTALTLKSTAAARLTQPV